MKASRIEWTDHTFSPWRGCTKVSAGCANCYAETMSKRNPSVLGEWGPTAARIVGSDAYWRQPIAWNREAEKAGRPARVFCASLSDVFEDRWDLSEPRWRLFDLISRTPNLRWLLLTKRPENILRLSPARWGVEVPRNVWVGTSAEDQATANWRIPALLKVPAAVLFVSAEPLLGPIDLDEFLFPDVDGYGAPTRHPRTLSWVIVGGESGPNARPLDLRWIEGIVESCKYANEPVFVKQDSGPRPGMQGRIPDDWWALKQVPDPGGEEATCRG